jgi:hypothetical protein
MRNITARERGATVDGPDPPVAFLSYVHADDGHERGAISAFRRELEGEVRAQTGRHDTRIFQDRDDIAWGEQWKRRVDSSLDTATFLIPILTPSFFNSAQCRRELRRFLERERRLNRRDLVLPVYWISADALAEPSRRPGDDLAHELSTRQYTDWRELRFQEITTGTARRALADVAIHFRRALGPADSRDRSRAAISDHVRAVISRSAERASNQDEMAGLVDVLVDAIRDCARLGEDDVLVPRSLSHLRLSRPARPPAAAAPTLTAPTLTAPEPAVAPDLMAPASVAPDLMAPASVAPASVAPDPVAPDLMAPAADLDPAADTYRAACLEVIEAATLAVARSTGDAALLAELLDAVREMVALAHPAGDDSGESSVAGLERAVRGRISALHPAERPAGTTEPPAVPVTVPMTEPAPAPDPVPMTAAADPVPVHAAGPRPDPVAADGERLSVPPPPLPAAALSSPAGETRPVPSSADGWKGPEAIVYFNQAKQAFYMGVAALSVWVSSLPWTLPVLRKYLPLPTVAGVIWSIFFALLALGALMSGLDRDRLSIGPHAVGLRFDGRIFVVAWSEVDRVWVEGGRIRILPLRPAAAATFTRRRYPPGVVDGTINLCRVRGFTGASVDNVRVALRTFAAEAFHDGPAPDPLGRR